MWYTSMEEYIMTLKYTIEDNGIVKKLTSDCYNYIYNRGTSYIIRWGTSAGEDPIYSPFGPELIIADITDMPMELFTVVFDTLTANRTITTFNLLQNGSRQDIINYCENNGITPVTSMNLETPSEAGFFSLHVDNNGIVRPASTCVEGIDIMSVNNFFVDIWQSDLFKTYRWEQLQRRQIQC